MPKRKTSVATVTLEVLDDWQAAAQHVESHIAGTRGVHAAYYREDLSPWPIEAAETLRHKTAIVIEHIESRESLNVRAFLERIREAAATWVTKRNFVIQFREIRHADRDAAVAAMDKLARFTNDGLPCQERLSLDLSIAEGAIWLAQFPLLAERTNGQPPFIIRHNLIRWVSWVQGAFSSAIHDWAVPGIAAIRPRQEGKRTSGASMESRERWELANVVCPRIVCDTNRTPKKLAIAEARRVGDLDVALPRIDKLLELLEVFVTAAARQPQGNIQPRCTEGLMRAVTALEDLVGSGEGDSGNVVWNAVTDRQRNCMRALLELTALDAESRQTTDEIAVRTEGREAKANAFKEPLSDLVGRGLVESKTGRQGGYWLTVDGRELLAAFDIDSVGDNPSP